MKNECLKCFKQGHLTKNCKYLGDEVSLFRKGEITVVVASKTNIQPATLITQWYNFRCLVLLYVSKNYSIDLDIYRAGMKEVKNISICDLVRITSLESLVKSTNELVTKETKNYSYQETGIRDVDINPDFKKYISLQKDRVQTLLETHDLISGVELPSPDYGYPTLDILGALSVTQMDIPSNCTEFQEVLRNKVLNDCGGIEIPIKSFERQAVYLFQAESRPKNNPKTDQLRVKVFELFLGCDVVEKETEEEEKKETPTYKVSECNIRVSHHSHSQAMQVNYLRPNVDESRDAWMHFDVELKQNSIFKK
jgi:hypothetical protein